MVISSVSVNDPSDTVKVVWYVPDCSYNGVQVKVLDYALNTAPVGMSDME